MTTTNLHPYVNVENCEKLAAYLESLPEDYQDFGMQAYIYPHNDAALEKYALQNGGVSSCGTAACAIGHGPAAGIYFPEDDDSLWHTSYQILYPDGPNTGRPVYSDEKARTPSWSAYSHRMFINPRTGADQGQLLWDWCFGSGWSSADDTPHGAAKRIRYLLDRLDREYPIPEFEGSEFDDLDLQWVHIAEFYVALYQ